MNDQTDSQLLHAYAEQRAEPAFAELVRRHVDFVYSAALRMVCDSHLAQDVTQSVFVALARQAPQLAGRPVLSGWLHVTAQNIAAQTVRTDVRRRAREQEAAAMNELQESETTWKQIAPHLDAALGELSEADRDALLLRYFERKSAQEMAQTLGISDEAAQKRVSRALERLREFFSKRKVTIGAGGLVALISTNAVQSAPIGLSATILTVTLMTTTTLGITMIHKILIAGMTAAVIGAGIYTFNLQGKIGSLQKELSMLNQRIEQITNERDTATNQLALLQYDNEQLYPNHLELLKLRDEVTRLRHQQNISPATEQMETNAPPDVLRIHLKTQFLSLLTEDVSAMGISWSSATQGGKIGSLTEKQFIAINEALQGASDVTSISVPQIVTINGNNATLSVMRTYPIDGTNANIGTSLDVTPYFSTNSLTFDLNLSAKFIQLTGDPSQSSMPDLQTILVTNQIDLSPGQTVVMEKEIQSSGWMPDATNIPAGPKSLLLFVTPTVVGAHDDFPKSQ